MSDASNSDERVSIGRIPLKQVRVHRQEESQSSRGSANPMNKLVPYLDLFARLGDDELSRLAGVEADVAATLRKQVVTIERALAHYVDLLPRLRDEELSRLTGASLKTIRFWRLCQPRVYSAAASTDSPAPSASPVTEGAEASSRGPSRTPTGTMRAANSDGVPRPQAEVHTAPQPVAEASPRRGLVPPGPGVKQPRPPGPAASSAGAKPAVIPVQTQAAVSDMMEFSGDPFPGFDDGYDEDASGPPVGNGAVSFSDVEGDDPLGGPV